MLICQITDTHIKMPGALAYGRVDTAAMLARCVAQIEALQPQPDLIVVTGDLVDLGRPAEYALLKTLLAPLRAPLLLIPGNHDDRDAMREAFADAGYLPSQGFLHFCTEDRFALRVIGLDTTIPQQSGGELCAERLAWLESTLARAPEQPTVVLMHHPPFLTGIGHMDAIGLQGREGFAEVMARHPQVQAVLCGHLHRAIHTQVGGRLALTCPSPAHQVCLDLRPEAPSQFRMDPPGFMLHRWEGGPSAGQWVSHVAAIGEFDGPYPFFDETGALID